MGLFSTHHDNNIGRRARFRTVVRVGKYKTDLASSFSTRKKDISLREIS